MRKACVFVATLPLLLACTPDDRPVTTAAALPANAPRVEAFVPPKVGTKLVYRTLSHQGTTSETTWIVGERTYQGKSALAAATPDESVIRLYDPATGHWFANLGKDGKPIWETSPPMQRFQWPLVVGARWSTNYAYYDRRSGQSWSPIVEGWTVESVENVTVPAGTFKAFRLQSSPLRNSAFTHTYWYAPELGTFVKDVIVRSRDHSAGYGKFETELIGYEPKL